MGILEVKKGEGEEKLPNSIFPLLVYSIYIFPYIFVLTCCTTNLCAIWTNHFHGKTDILNDVFCIKISAS